VCVVVASFDELCHCSVPLMKELLVLAPGALRKARQIKYFGGEAHDHVFPDGTVKALRAILVPGALRLDTAKVLDLLLDRVGGPP